MPSVIRLLPRRKIERQTVAYKHVLSWQFNRWLKYAIRTLLLCILPIAFVSSILTPHLSFTSSICALVLSSASVLLLFKNQMCIDLVPQPTAAKELLHTLKSKRLVGCLTVFVFSSLSYFYLIRPNWLIKHVYHEIAGLKGAPRGIPANLPLHLRGNWVETKAEYVYTELYFLVLGIAHGLYYSLSDKRVVNYTYKDLGTPSYLRIWRRVVANLKQSFIVSSIVALILPLVYYLAFNSWYSKLLISNPAFDVISKLPWSVCVYNLWAIPLVLVWEITYSVYTAYFTAGPVCKRRTFTDMAVDSDKNGCLVDGLSSNASTFSVFYAWYELLFIAEHEEGRRKSLFNDIDNERVIWEQIHQNFTKLINQQISDLNPAKPKPELQKPKEIEQLIPVNPSNTPQSVLLSNGKFEDQQPKQVKLGKDTEKLFHEPSALERKLAKYTQRIEGDAHAQTQAAEKFIHKGIVFVISLLRDVEIAFYKTRLGKLFMVTLNRTLNRQIQHKQTTAFALDAVAKLIVKSVEEDEYGYVQSSVADILNNLDLLATKLDALIVKPPVHPEAEKHITADDIAPMTILLSGVNYSFVQIAAVFEPYYDNLKVSQGVRTRTARIEDLPVSESAWIK